jgi:predicted small lipoprotein YifL
MYGNNLSLRSRNRCSSRLTASLAIALLLILTACGKKATVHPPTKASKTKTARQTAQPPGKGGREQVTKKGPAPAVPPLPRAPFRQRTFAPGRG